MPFSYRELICGGNTFCCCLPVRMGVISMSVIGMLVAGLLGIVLWFEVSVSPEMQPGGMAAFVLAAIMETILFIASLIGFVGAIVRKQSFVQAYAYILYVHFVCNIGSAAYLLYAIVEFQRRFDKEACQDTIGNTVSGTQEQCSGFLRLTKTVYIVVAAVVLFLELYGAIIVTRYLNQVKREKQAVKESRANLDNAFRLKSLNHQGLSYEPLNLNEPLDAQEEFNPYVHNGKGKDQSSYYGISEVSREPSVIVELNQPPMDVEYGYGGGLWTHTDISEEEKDRLKRETGHAPSNADDDMTDEQKDERRREQKSIHGPSSIPKDVDPLPLYTSTGYSGHL
ncbi:hypothetical protein FA15DRAFT_755597 [Coprinopsis marcescibilis]|uniref:Uncharacterized protein n=1 Tax=Coprinopsis marcescibilis TaxID=230819 RepID=A0A5C3KZP5_COPMA|nr:hypothetical protein FA15DRAFT_755597 [Coprinopsis marcescibilis]